MDSLKSEPIKSTYTEKSAWFDPEVYSQIKKDYVREDILLSNLKLDNINPVSCGQHKCRGSHVFGPAVRDYYLLHYIVSGEGYYYNHGKEYALSKGYIFIIRPNEITTYRASEKNPWFYRWVGFTSNLDLSSILSEDVIYAPECEYLYHLMVSVGNTNASKEYYICGKIFELLALLSHKNEPANTSHKYVEMAKNYIETNYNCTHISISEIAESLNLDRSYFSTLFKKCTGKSPQEYLLDFRLNKAVEMLTVSSLKAGEVGRACGYTDQFNFSKMFKRKFGLSPSQYARIHKQNID